MQRTVTEQEQFWAGEFGDQYLDRNRGELWVAANLALFARALRQAAPLASILEFGANIGLNLLALQQLFPAAELAAVEINPNAATELARNVPACTIANQAVQDFVPAKQFDLAFFKGVLIHLAPESLPAAYQTLYQSSRRYILIAEYYNPAPVEVPYRGHAGKLFKRDFAGEMLDTFPDLQLVDYGFVYHRDAKFPQDDLNWFLLEKRPA